MYKNVTNISGVPSWMLSVVVRVMELSGKQHLEEVWPNLEVFFHGGIAFTPYRKQYEQLITSPMMHYMETYNASEGFFGIQDDPSDPSMLLMLDTGGVLRVLPMEVLGSTRRHRGLGGRGAGAQLCHGVSTSWACGGIDRRQGAVHFQGPYKLYLRATYTTSSPSAKESHGQRREGTGLRLRANRRSH
jgi:hypothetical protein